MDTNGELGIMSHVGHLRRTLEMSQKNRLRKVFVAIVKFHKMSQMSQPNVTPATFSVRKIDYGLWNIPVKTDPNSTQKKITPLRVVSVRRLT